MRERPSRNPLCSQPRVHTRRPAARVGVVWHVLFSIISMNTQTNDLKPLGGKAYGSIPHLPGSRRGPADKGISDRQSEIATKKTRDRHDVVIVQEKLDGSNCSVAKISGEIIPLGRAGYRAISSRFEQHKHFHNWVFENHARFDELLEEGERCCGEWLAQAHGTKYELPHEPYVIFDIIKSGVRMPWNRLKERCQGFILPRTIHAGEGPLSVDAAIKLLEPSGHGAIDPVEGAVWRVERRGVVDFLAKYVRAEKVDGCYLPELTGCNPVWNWYPNSY